MKTKPRKKRGTPDPAILADIVNRIVEAANPEKIVLFGSAANNALIEPLARAGRMCRDAESGRENRTGEETESPTRAWHGGNRRRCAALRRNLLQLRRD